MERGEKIALILAIFLLLVGFVSALSLELKKEKIKEYIEIDGKKIEISEIFKKCSIIEMHNHSGIKLSCLINFSKINNPENYEYTIIGVDGYQQTVSWGDLNKGILTKEKRVVFENLPKFFWVRNVVKIEVI